MLFESRYGDSKLSIGFRPSATNFVFAQAYLYLVKCLAPEKWTSVALNLEETFSDVQFEIDGILAGKLSLQQNFHLSHREYLWPVSRSGTGSSLHAESPRAIFNTPQRMLIPGVLFPTQKSSYKGPYFGSSTL